MYEWYQTKYLYKSSQTALLNLILRDSNLNQTN